MKKCLLDKQKECNECLECDRCDLDPDKLCDNCCKCIETENEYNEVLISDIVTTDTEEYLCEYYKEEEGE